MWEWDGVGAEDELAEAEGGGGEEAVEDEDEEGDEVGPHALHPLRTQARRRFLTPWLRLVLT